MRDLTKITEATIQAEFYHWGRVLGLVSVLEASCPAGRLDLAILSNDRSRLLCIVECKSQSDLPMSESNQIRRYKRLGVPVYGLNNFDRAKGLVQTILSKNYEGIAVTDIMALQRMTRHGRKKRKCRHFKHAYDPDLNLKPSFSWS